jgi:hypothetical protein
MRMEQARTAIAAAITQAVTRAFRASHQAYQGRYTPVGPALRTGSHAAGHDAAQVPPVPPAQLRIDRDSASPGVVFTWKVESGQPPHAILRVAPQWLREVVRPGHAVLDGHPVLQVLDRQADGLPTEVLAVAVAGHFDSAIHGWRAHGAAVAKQVSWQPDGTARVEHS